MTEPAAVERPWHGRRFVLAVVAIVVVALLMAVAVGLLANRFRDETIRRDQQICAAQREDREATKTAILAAGIASGEALIEAAGSTDQERIERYRTLLTERLLAQLEIDLPPIVCTDAGPTPPEPSDISGG